MVGLHLLQNQCSCFFNFTRIYWKLGWTIVVLTILIKVVLYPLSYKGMMSMQKLKRFSTKMKDIQNKYKGDKQNNQWQ